MFNPEKITAEWEAEGEEKIRNDIARHYTYLLEEQQKNERDYEYKKKNIRDSMERLIKDVEEENWTAFHNFSKGPIEGFIPGAGYPTPGYR